MDNQTRIRRRTTADLALLPNEIIADALEDNTVDGVVDVENATGDVFDYLASVLEDGANVKSWTRGQVSVQYVQSYRDQGAFWHARSVQGGGVSMGKLRRDDWPAVPATQYGGAVYVQPPD